MAKELPYLASYKNVALLFEKIASAKIPEAFVQKYLYDILGLKNVGDRQLIPLLKAMGFIDQTGKPTSEYSKLKNHLLAGGSIANGIRKAYSALFDANEKAHTLSQPELKGLVAQVAGSDIDTTNKIAGTLNALFKVADFAKINENNKEPIPPKIMKKVILIWNPKMTTKEKIEIRGKYTLNFITIFKFIPNNANGETYLNTFNALRKSFQ